MKSKEVGLLGLLSLLASLVSGGSCLADYPSLPSSSVYSSSFTLTNQYVTGNSYKYYYFSATAGAEFTVTMTPNTVDLDLLGSKATYSLAPIALGNQFYSGAGGTYTDSFIIYPNKTECYVLGVYGWNGNSGYYSFSVIVTGTPAPSASPTSAPSTSVPTSAPTSQYICNQVIGDDPSLIYIEDDFSGGYTISGGEYDYYFYSSSSYSDITIKLKRASFGIAADVDLYVSDVSLHPLPTTAYSEYSSATTGSTIESIQISTSSAKCFAIAVWGVTAGSYQLETQSDPKIESSNNAMILGLSIGLPVSFCCVVPISIAVYVCMSRKSFRRGIPVVVMNKSMAVDVEGGVVTSSVGVRTWAVISDQPPAVNLPPAAGLPPTVEGEVAAAGVENSDDNVAPPSYHED